MAGDWLESDRLQSLVVYNVIHRSLRLFLNLLQFMVPALVLAGGCARPPLLHVAERPAIAQSESETVLEGALEAIIEDSDQGSRPQFFLISGDRRVPLRFVSSPPPNLTTGTRVRVRGRWQADDTLVVITIEKL